MTAKQFFNSKAWRRCRIVVLNRDHYKCTKCGKSAEEVHHDPPRALLPEKDWLNMEYCHSVCKPCHTVETNKEIDAATRLRERPGADGWMI